MEYIQIYINEVIRKYNTGEAREMAYRPALQNLIEGLNENITAINDPARISCGAPDFIILDKKNIPRGYIEAKDIIPNILDDKRSQIQITKYFDGQLGYNFIYTDNIEFRFYRNAELVETVKIAELKNNEIIPIPEEFEKLEMLLVNFLTFKTQTITSSKKLSEIMAGKARMIKRVIYMTLINNKDVQTEIHNQFEIFKKILVHDLDETGFADIYAQTITYGLFTARLHDPTLPTFDRDEAAHLLPKSNPFLKKFFQSLRDDLDPRVEWIVDDLVEIFLACDVKKLLDGYGKTNSRNDPIIHFYEDFLASYDAKLRKAKGVYYTPEPVVNFMIRGVDHILKNEFHLTDGIADTSKIEIEVDSDVKDERRKGGVKKTKKEVHKVQILDPATGTGTFLNDIVKYIYESRFEGMEGIWKAYVDENLLPRLHGFEIMMASYAMAHLKLDLTLTETGYKNENQERLGIYLTNSLEEEHEDAGTLFASFLSNESNQASYIKKNMPIMTIIGNPPYSGTSMNNGEWIQNLIKDYKKEPGGKEKLKERNPKWLNDDYVKFIRYAEQYIEKNGEGILAYISNNAYLDNTTFRGMRWKLLQTFDVIYIYDLHGNSLKKESCPNGGIDQNVFDIMVGVNIIFGIKNGKKNKGELATVYHYDCFGKRKEKYEELLNSSIENTKWNKLENIEPNYFFSGKSSKLGEIYNQGFKLTDLVIENSVGVLTHRDKYVIGDSLNELNEKITEVYNGDLEKLYLKYGLKKKGRFSLENIVRNNIDTYLKSIKKYDYRLFDERYVIYNDDFIDRSRKKVLGNMLKSNTSLIIQRQTYGLDFNHVFFSNKLSDLNYISNLGGGSVFPLYLYPKDPSKSPQRGDLFNSPPLEGEVSTVPVKTPNFNMEVIEKIEKQLGIKMISLNLLEESTGGKSEYDKPGYVTADSYSYKHIKETRDELKNNMTEAEKVLWEVLKTKKLGFKFRRQHIIDSFIADFVCLEKKLIIEVDGEIHEKQKERDFYRTQKLNELGFQVIRLKNEEVFANITTIIENIKTQLNTYSPPLEGLGEVFTQELSTGEVLTQEIFTPEDIFDYIYAVLHSKTYRETYKEFLKIDFPRVSFDVDKKTFFKMVELGRELRGYHLMENENLIPEKFITKFSIDGNNEVVKIRYEDENVFINDEQYFEGVSEDIWNFYIGGYQPAQKWLKDRKGRELHYEDILHYSKIILCLKETLRIMEEIEENYAIV